VSLILLFSLSLNKGKIISLEWYGPSKTPHYEIKALIEGSIKGRSPFKTSASPSPLKERGTKGVR